jgi:hypothetical protein
MGRRATDPVNGTGRMKRYTGWRASFIITGYVAVAAFIFALLVQLGAFVLGLSA